MSDGAGETTPDPLAVRRAEALADGWPEYMVSTAKYFCYACTGPDSWHTRDCPSDALDTCT